MSEQFFPLFASFPFFLFFFLYFNCAMTEISSRFWALPSAVTIPRATKIHFYSFDWAEFCNHILCQPSEWFPIFCATEQQPGKRTMYIVQSHKSQFWIQKTALNWYTTLNYIVGQWINWPRFEIGFRKSGTNSFSLLTCCRPIWNFIIPLLQLKPSNRW